MTQYQATRTAPPPQPGSSGIDLKTLWITAASSAAAAFACSQLWASGTLAAAAFTPVLVAIIREGLSKSTEAVAKAVPVKGVVRSARPRDPLADRGRVVGASPGQPAPLPADDPAARVPQPGEIAYHGSRQRARNWRVAIVTGLLGFVIAAVVFTVPELMAGGSASGDGRGTTLFGGQQRDDSVPADTTTTAPARTVTASAGEEETVTVPPPTVTAPAPAVTTPEQQQTTPAPTTTVPQPPPVTQPPPAGVP